MDYKQKYEQLTKFIKDLYPHMSDYCKEKTEGMIPELKELEDEKIRKEIIQFLQLPHPQFVGKRNHEGWIAWLEKQKKHSFLSKDEEYTLARIIEYLEDNGCPSTWKELLCDVYALSSQKEQKPEIKYIYPKFRVGNVIKPAKPNGHYVPVRVKYIGEGNYSCESDDHKTFLSFPIYNENEYVLIEQKHVEWNEEDEIRTAQIISDFEKCSVPGFPILINNIEFKINWLKSLKERIKEK